MIGSFNGDQAVHPGTPQIAGDGITQQLNDLLATSYADNTIASCSRKMTVFITFLARCSLMDHAWNRAKPVDPRSTLFC